MKLITILLADLQRQYYYAGITENSPTFSGLLRYSFNPRFTPILLCRLSHYFYVHRLLPMARVMSFLNFLVFGIEIAMRCEIGEGLYLPHTAGTVIGALKIGKNAVIYQGVTIGAKTIDLSYQENSRPTIGDNVVLGAGVKVLGNVLIGSNITVGANAVVNKSLPDGVVAVGVPARVIQKNDSVIVS